MYIYIYTYIYIYIYIYICRPVYKYVYIYLFTIYNTIHVYFFRYMHVRERAYVLLASQFFDSTKSNYLFSVSYSKYTSACLYKY